MKSNYKRLGDYIRLTDERNSDLTITNLQGVSIEKKFIPSIANIIGTDLSNYKIVRKGQFAYGPVTSRNGDKISVALLDDDDCIISSSYISFEVVDKNILNPEYLMLWFMRPEFDRYARFMSHGSAREIFDWNCMCNVKLPIPPISEQIKVVNYYKTINVRIELLKTINKNLRVLATTIYLNFVKDKICNGTISQIVIDSIKSKIQVRSADNSGLYPFFTSGKSILSHSQYLVDGKNLFINTGGKFDVKYYDGKASYSTDTLCLNVKKGLEVYLYLYLFNNFEQINETCFHGSALKHLQKDQFYNLNIYIPSDYENQIISNIFDSVFNLVLKHEKEIETLINFKNYIISKM